MCPSTVWILSLIDAIDWSNHLKNHRMSVLTVNLGPWDDHKVGPYMTLQMEL